MQGRHHLRVSFGQGVSPLTADLAVADVGVMFSEGRRGGKSIATKASE
jgi:hypothetical protein